MLIERALRDRVTAIQNGPSDLGMFGATSGTFQTLGGGTAGAVTLGPMAGAVDQARAISHSDSGGGFGITRVDTETVAVGGIETPEWSITARAEAQSFAQQSTATSSSGTGYQHDAAFGGATTLTVQTVARDGDTTHVQTTSLTTGGAVEHVAGAAAGAATTQLGAIETGLAQARADALDRIETIASTAAAQVAAIQAHLAETIVSAGAQVAALGNSVGDALLDIGAPVLDIVAGLPDTIGTRIATDIDLGLDGALRLGDDQIEIAQQIAITTDLALEAGLPIDGDDVAGGIATLVDLVTSEGGYLVEDVTAGIAWPLAANPVDTLTELAGDDPAIAPASILLGIADPGGLLDGLSDHDDFGLGLG